MDKWFEQEAEENGLAGALKNLFRYANHPVAKKNLQNKVRCQTITPVSVNAVMKLLADWNIKASTYFISLEQLPGSSLPHISFIRDTINDREAQWPVLILAAKTEEVRYVHPVKGVVNEPIVDFSQKWNNVVIAVPDIAQPLN
jgi:hypothetical protein